jgi:tetratricopeptide (TPR) repeat protein
MRVSITNFLRSQCLFKFAALLVAMIYSLSFNAQTEDEWKQNTIHFFENGMEDSLNFALDQALKKFPNSLFFKDIQVRALLSTKKFELAKPLIDKMMSSYPDSARVYFLRGLYYHSQEFNAFAANDFQRAIELGTNNPSCYLFFAKRENDRGEYIKAIDYCNNGLKLEPKYSDLICEKARSYMSLDSNKTAITLCDQLLSIDSTSINALIIKSEIHYKEENLNLSCDQLEKIFLILDTTSTFEYQYFQQIKVFHSYCDSSASSYFYQRGIAAFNLRKFETALSYYNRGLALFPNSAMNMCFMGNACMKLARYSEASACYEQTLKLLPFLGDEVKSNPKTKQFQNNELNQYLGSFECQTYLSMAECYFNQNEIAKARFYWNKAKEVKPKDFSILDFEIKKWEGIFLFYEGNLTNALDLFNKQINDYPTECLTYVLRCLLTLEQLEVIQKRTYIQVSLVGGYLPIYEQKKIKRKSVDLNSKIQQALNDIQMAISLDPSIGYFYYVKSLVKYVYGSDSACLELRKAKELGFESAQFEQEMCN